MRNWLKIKIIVGVFISLWLTTSVFAQTTTEENSFYQNKTNATAQQIDLLKNRLIQSKLELSKLQQQKEKLLVSFSMDQVNKQTLNQALLDVSVAKSNSDSISIELSEAEQTIVRLEKDIQEIENQLNVYNIFGLKVDRGATNVINLQQEQSFQKKLLSLEKKRSLYLKQLQVLSNNVIQLQKFKYNHFETILKSQTILQLKQQQAKSEVGFQQQQSFWLKQLNSLYAQLNQMKPVNKTAYNKLENEIFYANENVNFTYLKMMVVRYHDQIQQLKASISHSSSITLLNKVNDQAQGLGKQLDRVTELLKTRIDILDKRKNLLLQLKDESRDYVMGVTNLVHQYTAAIQTVNELNQQLIAFRLALDQALQQELSSRQGLPGFSAKAWLDLGAELLLVPPLTFQVVKSLAYHFFKAFHTINYGWWLLLFGLEMAWFTVFYFLKYALARRVLGMPDHEFGHVNLKWLFIKLAHRNMIDIALIGNLFWLFPYCGIPSQNFNFLIKLAWVWLFFKVLLNTARLCLVETMHHRSGHDVRLYYHLKWSFVIGGVIIAFTVFIQQLPLVYEVKDLFVRFFLFFLLIVSVFLLRSWQVLPTLILPYVDERHTYVQKVVRLMCILIPLILLVNSIIGLFGFVNLVLTISWYESVYLMVLVVYLFVRGLLSDAMHIVSQLFIKHLSNGWVWTEAVLKPLDKVFRAVLFFAAWIILFMIYGWDRQSPIVRGMTHFLNYHIVDMLNTSITPLCIIELFAIGSFFFWAARWTREFVYRLLLSRTSDLGIRNSIAILSQYSLIVLGLFICLRVLGIDFRALTVVAGMLAFGVGLGLRDLANNFVCGFLLLFERPLRVGDTVTLGGYEGEVMHIGGRAVTIRTWDHMEVLVPNAEIFSKSFINWTVKDNIVRSVISLKISRHDKPQDVQRLIHGVLAAQANILKDPVPEVFLKEMTEGLIEFEIRYHINLRQVKSRLGVRSEVLISLWECFERNDIHPAYPHHEVFLKGNMGMPLLEKNISSLI